MLHGQTSANFVRRKWLDSSSRRRPLCAARRLARRHQGDIVPQEDWLVRGAPTVAPTGAQIADLHRLERRRVHHPRRPRQSTLPRLLPTPDLHEGRRRRANTVVASAEAHAQDVLPLRAHRLQEHVQERLFAPQDQPYCQIDQHSTFRTAASARPKVVSQRTGTCRRSTSPSRSALVALPHSICT